MVPLRSEPSPNKPSSLSRSFCDGCIFSFNSSSSQQFQWKNMQLVVGMMHSGVTMNNMDSITMCNQLQVSITRHYEEI